MLYFTKLGKLLLEHINSTRVLGLEPEPTSNTATSHGPWKKSDAKAKATIVLNLGSVVKVRVCSYIDVEDADEKTA